MKPAVPGMRVTDVASRPVGTVAATWDDGSLEVRMDNGEVLKVSPLAVYYVNQAVRLVCNWDQLHRYRID